MSPDAAVGTMFRGFAAPAVDEFCDAARAGMPISRSETKHLSASCMLDTGSTLCCSVRQSSLGKQAREACAVDTSFKINIMGNLCREPSNMVERVRGLKRELTQQW